MFKPKNNSSRSFDVASRGLICLFQVNRIMYWILQNPQKILAICSLWCPCAPRYDQQCFEDTFFIPIKIMKNSNSARPTIRSLATEQQHSLQTSFNRQRVKRLFFFCATATEHCNISSLADSDGGNSGNAVFVFAAIIK